MAKRTDIIEGLQILEKYDPGTHGVCAEHDIIYGGCYAVSPEDRERLLALGWHHDRESGSWARFV